MKMRCVGAEEPPCKRCRNAGLECVMEKPGRSGGDSVGDEYVSKSEPKLTIRRIKSLENQVTAIQGTLTDLVTTLRAGMAAGQLHQSTETIPLPPPPPPQPAMQANDFSLFNLHQNYGFPPKQEVLIGPRFDGSDPGSTPSYRSQAASPYASLTDFSKFGSSMPILPAELQNPQPTIPAISLPPSRLGSPGADQDILGPEEITNPLGALDNMAGLVEAAVERAREEQSPLKRPSDNKGDERPVKKTRFSPEHPSGPIITEAQNLPPTRKRRGKRTHIHAYPDAVSEGYVTEAEGRELMAM